MPQRVSDELLASTLAGKVSFYYPDRDVAMFAKDLADARAENARAIADANAAILRLQKRLDAVRPVVRAAVAMRMDKRDESENDSAAYVMAAVDALPAADREWAEKGE